MSDFIKDKFNGVIFPPVESVYSFYLNSQTVEFLSWQDQV